ncbi:hypothetical protein AC579_9109 [Pseudocercospora musae]|uniref:Probable glucan endo-1,3-beta-glucosidase eglC n=1 Tax=Pseudocercospora musae TaxID=113226 RepID=A0A139IIR3_9PEZI|nr:hypothetical protein AC579_9109 [Pseudocercospora musae]
MYLLNIILLASTVAAQALKGFNSGGYGPNGLKRAADFKKEFEKIHNLPGAPGFSTARLFTMIQGETDGEPVEAFQPAIETKTKLLLGLWASAGQDAFNKELGALKKAISAHGNVWKDIVYAICVGSEDLYRITPTGIANKAGIGESPQKLVDYIKQTRDAIKGTPAEGTQICHVDTWTAWVNGTNSPVIDAVDWIGFDGYPYYEKDTGINSIENAHKLFQDSFDKTVAVSKGKPVKITETGWPIQGPNDFGKSVASIDNAKRYWHDVGCQIFGKHDTWWFTLDDTKKNPGEISFSTVKPNLGDPLWDLKC